MTSAGTALKIIWTFVLVLVAGGVGVLLANWLKNALRVKADKQHLLKLVNDGNFPSLYHLSFKSSQAELTFTCTYDNIPLVPVFEETTEPFSPETVRVDDTGPDQKTSGNGKKVKAGKGNPDAALKAGKSVAAKSGVVASLLGTLGGILPGALGAGLKEKADMARSVQINTTRVTQAPQTTTNKMDALKSSGSKLGVGSLDQNKSRGGGSGSIAAASSPPSNQVVITAKAARGDDYPTKLSNTGQVQTRALSSGEELLLTLKIGTSAKRYPAGSFNYIVQSQQIPVEGRFDRPAPVSKTGTVYFKPISNFRYLLPAIGSILVLLLALLGIYYGLIYVWG
jgi:hypothetical protein